MTFLPQTRCHASKRGFHLRRTVKLDPVAELFLYDLVYRNRTHYRPDFSPKRRCFGYRFVKGEALSAKGSYVNFKTSVSLARSSTSTLLNLMLLLTSILYISTILAKLETVLGDL